ncbi:pRL2-8 [Streptomyces antnestii]|uniref:PRL2-8 n=1 Tax=Streptomyces antnestii TaxID=2494256 RepID=A0A437PY92_9ACTN|nr:pRL2-8 [Streptomyces sp. San01]RVU27193.1 pRL2-8 [Streptomyces sp. San01]
MALFGNPRTAHSSMSTPEGECPQCWRHAYDRAIHRRLGPREDCPQCVDHMVNGCPGFNRR